MSEIPHEVRALAGTLKVQATRLGDLVRALKSTPFGDDLACEISELLVTLAGHHADLNKLQSLVGAAGMVGMVGPRRAEGLQLRTGDLWTLTVAEAQERERELELRPGDLMEERRQQERMLLSLHRAGDHTLDEEDDFDA